MNTDQRFRGTQEREFFAHHMLLHAAGLQLEEAEASKVGRFNKCLAAMVLSSLAIEALANAVGSRVASDWPAFERLNPLEKLDALVVQLAIVRDPTKNPWSAITQLARFRNDIAHPKPELVVKEKVLFEAGIEKTMFETPKSVLERRITIGEARRAHNAVNALKKLLTEALPPENRYGISVEVGWGSIKLVE